jgi:hypothetical protein
LPCLSFSPFLPLLALLRSFAQRSPTPDVACSAATTSGSGVRSGSLRQFVVVIIIKFHMPRNRQGVRLFTSNYVRKSL